VDSVKILFVSDSLALPRKKPETVLYDQTYVGILKRRLESCDILQQSMGRATLPELYNQSFSYYSAYDPDAVIIQAGIVDCAPRALKKAELQLILSNKLLRKIWNRIGKRYSDRLRRIRRITDTTPNEFRRYVKRYKDLFGSTSILWIPIMPASSAYEKLAPGITENIELYNGIINDEMGNSVIRLAADTSWLMSDWHHLNLKWHHKIAIAVQHKLDEKTAQLRGNESSGSAAK